MPAMYIPITYNVGMKCNRCKGAYLKPLKKSASLEYDDARLQFPFSYVGVPISELPCFHIN